MDYGISIRRCWLQHIRAKNRRDCHTGIKILVVDRWLGGRPPSSSSERWATARTLIVQPLQFHYSAAAHATRESIPAFTIWDANSLPNCRCPSTSKPVAWARGMFHPTTPTNPRGNSAVPTFQLTRATVPQAVTRTFSKRQPCGSVRSKQPR